jgi:uncharacterized membrane protein YcjF (UPF0283 family)
MREVISMIEIVVTAPAWVEDLTGWVRLAAALLALLAGVIGIATKVRKLVKRRKKKQQQQQKIAQIGPILDDGGDDPEPGKLAA